LQTQRISFFIQWEIVAGAKWDIIQ